MLAALAATVAFSSLNTVKAQGVNYANGNRNTVATQNADLAAMQRAGVKLIRFPLETFAGSYASSIALAKLAATYGIKTFFVISLQDDANLYAGGTVKRTGGSGIFDAYPFSSLSPTAAAAVLSSQLAQAPVYAGVELGNELNNASFNGDFTTASGGVVINLNGSDSETTNIKTGFNNYITLLGLLRQFIASDVVSGSVFVPAGNVVGASTGTTFDMAELNATLSYLKAQGLDPLVNEYGVHLYPFGTATTIAMLEGIAFAQCGNVHPCYLTEWGILNSSTAPAQIDRVNSFLAYLKGVSMVGKIYFDWSGTKFGLFHDNVLSLTGSAVLQGE